MLKRAVLVARNIGIRLKKQRFLKLFFIFVGIKKVYHSPDFVIAYPKNLRQRV